MASCEEINRKISRKFGISSHPDVNLMSMHTPCRSV